MTPSARISGKRRHVSHERTWSREGTLAASALTTGRRYQCGFRLSNAMRCSAGEERRAGGFAFLAAELFGIGQSLLGQRARVGPVDLDQVVRRIAEVELHPACRVDAKRRAECPRVEDPQLLRAGVQRVEVVDLERDV